MINETITEYAKISKKNRYSPMAINSIASAFASIYGEQDGIKAERGESEYEPLTEDLDARIQKAKEQGMRWNHRNEMPNNPATVQKKVREWEKEFNSGHRSEMTHKSYETLLQDTSKGFITGLCVSVEEKYGYEQSASPYLKRRYLKLRDLVLKDQGVKVVKDSTVLTQEANKSSLTPDEVADGMYESLYKGVSIEVHHDNVTSVWKRIASNDFDGDFRKIPGHTLAKSATLGGLPTTLQWDSEEEKENTVNRRRFTLEQRDKYADQFKSIVDKYLDSIGY
jgi:hypothetical protein